MASKMILYVQSSSKSRLGALKTQLLTAVTEPSLRYEVTTERDPNFDSEAFFGHLRTRSMGRAIITAPKLTSTFDVFKTFFGGNFNDDLSDGLVVMAEEQSMGVGRGNNIWTSPKGSFLFSVRHITNSPLYLSLVQHLAGLALLLASRELYKVTNLSLKWPNDIYWSGDETHKLKIGGVLVKTSVYGNSRFVVDIGLGLNLNNEEPTMSLSQIVKCALQRESLLGLTLNHLESLITLMQTNQGVEEVLELYHQHWMHSNQKIRVQRQLVISNNDDNEITEWLSAIIVGIDESGYLLVRLENGEVQAVRPDGNSFDLMQGLVLPKKLKIDTK